MKLSNLVPTRDYLCNHVVSRIPYHGLRMRVYRRLGVRIGEGSTIFLSTHMQEASGISIGEATVINPHCSLDGRGGLRIGSNVNISSHVLLVAGSHDIRADHFDGSVRPITVEDYVWLCTRCTILAGVTVGRGAVVAAGAVVTRSVEPNAVVAGVPAVKIGERCQELCYSLANYDLSWQ